MYCPKKPLPKYFKKIGNAKNDKNIEIIPGDPDIIAVSKNFFLIFIFDLCSLSINHYKLKVN